jgi:hypothetical protein
MPTLSRSLLGVAAGLWFLLPVAVLIGGAWTPRTVWSAVLGLGAVALLGAALCLVPIDRMCFTLPRPLFLGTVAFAFHLDALAAWFLGVIALVMVSCGRTLSPGAGD